MRAQKQGTMMRGEPPRTPETIHNLAALCAEKRSTQASRAHKTKAPSTKRKKAKINDSL